MTGSLVLKGVRKTYGSVVALEGIDLERASDTGRPVEL